MFSVIKNHIAGKHPALRVDLRTNFLKNAVIRAHRLGQIDCVSKGNVLAMFNVILTFLCSVLNIIKNFDFMSECTIALCGCFVLLYLN